MAEQEVRDPKIRSSASELCGKTAERRQIRQPLCSAGTSKSRLMLGCICLFVFSSLQCGRGDKRASVNDFKITVLYPGDEGILGPNWDMPAKFLMFLRLVTYDENGELESRLAKSWEHSPDYREWTFHLRTDVKWHDGVSVTAHDIKFTMELLSHPAVGYERPNSFSITVLDDSTYTNTYDKLAGWPLDSYTAHYPKHLLENLDPEDFYQWEFWTQPVGNGPYRYVRHVSKTMIELEANPDFYKGKPKIERVILKFGGTAPLIELLSGNVDILTYVNSADIPKLEADPRFRVYYHLWPDLAWLAAIFWNQRSPLLHDSVVRRALTLAINRRELHRVLNLPDDLRIFDAIFIGRQYWHGELPEPLPYDPGLAKRLLDEAGWTDQDGDGVRKRDGEAFRLVALVPARGGMGDRSLEQAAVYVQEQLRRVGVSMEVQVLERNLVRKKIQSADYEAAFQTFPNWIDGPITWFGEGSGTVYDDPRIPPLVDAAQKTMNPDEMEGIYRELMSVFSAELPITFLFPRVQTIVAHRRIKGLNSPFWSDPVMNIEHLWIEDESGEAE